MTTLKSEPLLVIVGQTPPPWHGQAVATQLLFDHEWPGFQVCRVRMAFSEEMEEIGRVQIRKILHVFEIWKAISDATGCNRDGILIYPPASPNWTPVLRDLILLPWIRRRFGKVIYIYHAGGVGEWFTKSRLRRWVGRLAYGRSDLNLEVAREAPSPHEVLRARRWAWTPYGVNVPALLEKTSKGDGATVVLFVGSLQEGKGVLEIIRTAAILKAGGREADFRFRLVGKWFSMEFEEQARRLVAELGIEAMMEFPGQLTGTEKWQAYRGANLFLFPTHYESEAFPLVLIEALACGLPVITTRWRGIPDLVAGCEAATLCGIHSPEEYADAIELWRSNLKSSDGSAVLARSFYEERYKPEQFLAQVMSLVAEVSGKRADAEPIRTPVYTHGVTRSFHSTPSALEISAYLADQNPGHDRSLGISRMSKVVLGEMARRDDISLQVITSLSSQQGPKSAAHVQTLPWSTRTRIMRLLTDQLHPVLAWFTTSPDIWYFPKGFLPRFNLLKAPTVVTVHDTIIQHHADHYPHWRKKPEYAYWARMLRHTLRHADVVLTVSEHSRAMIIAFMARHKLPEREITVTYEPCCYEGFEQPHDPPKGDHVLHLASREPHKRSHDLIRWWAARTRVDSSLPVLELVGNIPSESWDIVASNSCFRRRPFLDDEELRNTITQARALILPSEIEGFGLPAIEAYYLGTPVCFTKGTSIEEILGQSTSTGGFDLNAPESLWPALQEVLAMPAGEIRRIGLGLRERFAVEKIVGRMIAAFREVAGVC
jgi:glycosyltransferase involved in cell wall biosynthesis